MASTIARDQLAGTVQTPGAAATTLITIPIPAGATVGIEANVCAHVLATSGAYFVLGGCYRNNGGVVSLVGANVGLITNRDAAVITATLTFVISGTNVIVTVTGVAATTIEWGGFANIFVSI